mmetsp:Transcript_2148/g.5692  ORF Transcript_2148/g.5692 Transcript_2148/m.5692 type:complete len:288 (-) Transcript_2148:144-1007(-)
MRLLLKDLPSRTEAAIGWPVCLRPAASGTKLANRTRKARSIRNRARKSTSDAQLVDCISVRCGSVRKLCDTPSVEKLVVATRSCRSVCLFCWFVRFPAWLRLRFEVRRKSVVSGITRKGKVARLSHRNGPFVRFGDVDRGRPPGSFATVRARPISSLLHRCSAPSRKRAKRRGCEPSIFVRRWLAIARCGAGNPERRRSAGRSTAGGRTGARASSLRPAGRTSRSSVRGGSARGAGPSAGDPETAGAPGGSSTRRSCSEGSRIASRRAAGGTGALRGAALRRKPPAA